MTKGSWGQWDMQAIVATILRVGRQAQGRPKQLGDDQDSR